ncbi:hypothetical protein [Planococcus maritimus]|nr:hypothetical protein [Planococcus maritimus]KYG58361.1 hypothetical protein AY633_08775 [Planococcus maritimus]OED31885.1 hypothetical protein BHE17_05330 [Planococcus maritimus]
MDLLNEPASPVEVHRAISFEWAFMSYRTEGKLKDSMKNRTAEKPKISFDKEVIEFCYLTGTIIEVDMYIHQLEDNESC